MLKFKLLLLLLVTFKQIHYNPNHQNYKLDLCFSTSFSFSSEHPLSFSRKSSTYLPTISCSMRKPSCPSSVPSTWYWQWGMPAAIWKGREREVKQKEREKWKDWQDVEYNNTNSIIVSTVLLKLQGSAP